MDSRSGVINDANAQRDAEGISAQRAEIERKFLVASLPDLRSLSSEAILQGYISTVADCAEVRVRQRGSKYFQPSRATAA